MSRLRVALMSVLLIGPAVAAGAPVIAHAATCTAQGAGAYPNDPEFASAENNPSSGQTWDGEDWYLYGCIPQSAPSSADPDAMSGMNVAGLWNRAANPQRGRDDVTVAYMEGGVNWRIGTSCELKDRAKLNTGELPYPKDRNGVDHGTYDLNGDHVVNVEDYVSDPR